MLQQTIWLTHANLEQMLEPFLQPRDQHMAIKNIVFDTSHVELSQFVFVFPHSITYISHVLEGSTVK